MARKKKKGSKSKALQSIAFATAVLTLIQAAIEFLKLIAEIILKLLE